MELSNLMKCIGENDIPHYLIFFGEEQKIIDMYIEQIKKLYKPVYSDSVAFVVNQLSKKSLDKSNKVYIVTEDTDYQKAESRWEQIKQQINKSNHILILRYATLNKKLKFYIQNKSSAVEFAHLQPNILTQYIQKDINLSEENCAKLISMCGNDYGRILLEVDKLNQYRQSTFHDTEGIYEVECDEAFDILLKQGAIYSEIGDITFELTDAILGGYSDKAIKILSEAKRKGEPALRIVSILYDGFRNLLSYQSLGSNKKDASQRTGLTGWQIKKCIDLAGGYSISELVRNMLFCQEVEYGIKSGFLDEDISLEYITLHCIK